MQPKIKGYLVKWIQIKIHSVPTSSANPKPLSKC